MPHLFISSLVLSLSVPPVVAPPSIRASIPAAVQTAAQASSPDARAAWQQRRDAAERRRHTGTVLAWSGGLFALSAAGSSIVCTTGDHGNCGTARAIVGGLTAAGVVTASIGLIKRSRASAELRDLDAHPPR